MKKKFLVVFSFMLAVMLTFGSSLTALAATGSVAGTEGEETLNENTTSKVDVSVTVESTFSVKIPKKVTLNGSTKTGTYNIAVKGDIAGNESISVTAPTTITLKQAGKADITASNELDKSSWAFDDINSDTYTATTNTITAADATAGLWSGDVTFTIQLVTSN